MSDTIQYELRDTIATLRLNREDRHNAIGAQELKQMDATLELIERDANVRVLIVTGAGSKTFCAGASLDDLNAGEITPEGFQRVMQRVAELPIPTLARVNGNIFGGGTELALSCDFRIGVAGTRVRVPAASLGLCYPPHGIASFVKRLGGNLPRRMLLGAETLSAEELYRLSFYDYLVDEETLDERTDELAIHLEGLAPMAVRAMKELIRQSEAGTVVDAQAKALFIGCEESADLQEGFAALREKRAPEFANK
ncbi:MAG: enoyl-CoA hydratase/isomerase family protein [Pseudomonadota bacterium]